MSLHRDGLPVRLLDVLETDGGWLTTEGLASMSGASEATTVQALKRLKARGLVADRIVQLAATKPGWGGHGGIDRRREWRLP